MAPVLCVRLKSFYQREWDKVHQIYQEEADKCCMLMEEQVRTYVHTHVCKCAEPCSVYKNVTGCVCQDCSLHFEYRNSVLG